MRRSTLLFIPLLSCAAVPTDPGPVTGSWGGQHVAMMATPTAISFEFDCAAGRIDGPLVPMRNGSFSVEGVYLPGHGGPVRIDEIPRLLPAVYRGTIAGGEMQLTIDIPSERQVVGPFRLRRGAQPMVFRCL